MRKNCSKAFVIAITLGVLAISVSTYAVPVIPEPTITIIRNHYHGLRIEDITFALAFRDENWDWEIPEVDPDHQPAPLPAASGYGLNELTHILDQCPSEYVKHNIVTSFCNGFVDGYNYKEGHVSAEQIRAYYEEDLEVDNLKRAYAAGVNHYLSLQHDPPPSPWIAPQL